MSQNDWKNRLGVVFSTDFDFNYTINNNKDDAIHTLAPEKQYLTVIIDRKQRAGKQVTLIKGFQGSKEDLESLAKILKNKCGTGGSAKEGEIIIQGDFRDKIINILQGMNYKAKLGN